MHDLKQDPLAIGTVVALVEDLAQALAEAKMPLAFQIEEVIHNECHGGQQRSYVIRRHNQRFSVPCIAVENWNSDYAIHVRSSASPPRTWWSLAPEKKAAPTEESGGKEPSRAGDGT